MEQKRARVLAIISLCVGISSWVFGYIGLFGGPITGLILGILPGIFAIVFGAIAIVQVRKGSHKGRWMTVAIAGIVSGILGIGSWGVLLILRFIDWLIYGPT